MVLVVVAEWQAERNVVEPWCCKGQYDAHQPLLHRDVTRCLRVDPSIAAWTL